MPTNFNRSVSVVVATAFFAGPKFQKTASDVFSIVVGRTASGRLPPFPAGECKYKRWQETHSFYLDWLHRD